MDSRYRSWLEQLARAAEDNFQNDLPERRAVGMLAGLLCEADDRQRDIESRLRAVEEVVRRIERLVGGVAATILPAD